MFGAIAGLLGAGAQQLIQGAGKATVDSTSSILQSKMNDAFLGSPGERARKYMQQAYPGATTSQMLGAQGGGMAGTPGQMDAARMDWNKAKLQSRTQLQAARINAKVARDTKVPWGEIISSITGALGNKGSVGSKVENAGSWTGQKVEGIKDTRMMTQQQERLKAAVIKKYGVKRGNQIYLKLKNDPNYRPPNE